MTLKEAVNRILTSVGENPITSDPRDNIKNPTVSIILRSLDDVSKGIQTRGFWFNKRKVTIVPNFKQQMVLPEGTINWVADSGRSYQRGNILVQADSGTTLWATGDKESGTVTTYIEFEELPHSFAEVVVLQANLQTYRNTFGIDEHYKALENLVPYAQDNLTADVVRFGQYNTRRRPAWGTIRDAMYR